jgi:hypothetical protein
LSAEQAFVPNVFLALLLTFWMLKDRRAEVAFGALLVYCTMHFFGGALLLFFPKQTEVMQEVHSRPIIGVKLVGAAFILFFLVLLALRYRRTLWIQAQQAPWLVVVACLVLVVAGAAWKAHTDLTLPSIQDVVSMLTLPAVAFLLTVAWREDGGRLPSLLPTVVALTTVVVGGALLELAISQPYSTNALPDGRILERASSTLFNPNVLGMWCAGVAAFASYCWTRRGEGRRWAAALLLLAGFGLLLSGSRSGLLLYLMVWIVAVVVVDPPERRSALSPLALFLGSGLVAGSFSAALERVVSAPPPLRELAVLFDRMVSLPVDLANYALSLLGTSLPWKSILSEENPPADIEENPPADAQGAGGTTPSPESEIFATSAVGRFGEDNAYLDILRDAGWLGLVGWIGVLVAVAWLLWRHLWSHRDPAAAHSFAAVVGFVISGMFLRTYQVFPVWVFLAAVLAIVVIEASSNELKAGARGD